MNYLYLYHYPCALLLHLLTLHNEIDTVNSMIQNGAVTDRNGTKNYNRLFNFGTVVLVCDHSRVGSHMLVSQFEGRDNSAMVKTMRVVNLFVVIKLPTKPCLPSGMGQGYNQR